MKGSKAYSHFKIPLSSYCCSPMAVFQQLHTTKSDPADPLTIKRDRVIHHSMSITFCSFPQTGNQPGNVCLHTDIMDILGALKYNMIP